MVLFFLLSTFGAKIRRFLISPTILLIFLFPLQLEARNKSKSGNMSDLLSKQLLSALGLVASLVLTGVVASQTMLPKRSSTKVKSISIWLAFDALTHFIIEGSFLYYSINGRTVNSSKSFLAVLFPSTSLMTLTTQSSKV